MNGLQALPAWQKDFGHPKGQLLGAVNAAQSAGSILMLPICGTLSDKIGRRWTLFLGGVMIIVASVIQSASVNIAMFTIIQPSPMLISELCYPTHRGIYTAMFWTCYYVGAIIASWSTYGLQKNVPDSRWAWRGPSILQGGLPLLQLLFVSHHVRSACVAKSVTLTQRISGMPCLNLLGGLSHRAVRTKPELSLLNTIPEVKKITHS
jgi:MFS family permease